MTLMMMRRPKTEIVKAQIESKREMGMEMIKTNKIRRRRRMPRHLKKARQRRTRERMVKVKVQREKMEKRMRS